MSAAASAAARRAVLRELSGKTAGVAAPAYRDVGVAALRKALLRSRINVYDQPTVDLLRCLQNVHDVFGTWEWNECLASIARKFGLSA